MPSCDTERLPRVLVRVRPGVRRRYRTRAAFQAPPRSRVDSSPCNVVRQSCIAMPHQLHRRSLKHSGAMQTRAERMAKRMEGRFASIIVFHQNFSGSQIAPVLLRLGHQRSEDRRCWPLTWNRAAKFSSCSRQIAMQKQFACFRFLVVRSLTTRCGLTKSNLRSPYCNLLISPRRNPVRAAVK